MSSFNEKNRASINKEVALHIGEVKGLKKDFAVKLTSYRKSVEELKRSYDKYSRAAKKYDKNVNEKNEILFVGAEKVLVKSIIATDDCAKAVNDVLDNIDAKYTSVIDLLVEVDAKAATKAAAGRRSFMEKAAMEMDEAHQIIADMPAPTVDATAKKILSFTDKPEEKSPIDKSWDAHGYNTKLNAAKNALKCLMPVYKKAVQSLERAALDLAKAKKKYGNTTSAKGRVLLDEAKGKYLAAVSAHNEAATDLNVAADDVFACYESLKTALANGNRRTLIKVASEQDEYHERFMREIGNIRKPLADIGIKNVK